MLAFCSITKTDTKCTTQSMCIVELCKQFEGSDRALVARAFFTSNSCNKVLVRILNVHNEIQSLKKGTYIAELNPVDEVFEARKVAQKINTSAELPEDMIDLFERSSQGMSPSNKNTLLQLLLKYNTSFATSDRDLGKTDIIKHRIDTGDNAPIKQANAIRAKRSR